MGLLALGVVATVGIAVLGVVLAPHVFDEIRSFNEVCGETERRLDVAEASPDAGARTPAALGAVVPDEMGPGYVDVGQRTIPDAATVGHERGDDWRVELERDGFVRGYEHRWRAPSGELVSVKVYEFRTHTGARAFERWIDVASCRSSHDAFEATAIPGSVGLQIHWSNGDVSEQVSFVRATRRYVVSVRGAAAPDRGEVLTVAERAAKAAT